MSERANVVDFPKRESSIEGLTTLQLRTLRFVEGTVARHGRWPSIREIQDSTGIESTIGAIMVVEKLIEAKAISRPPTGLTVICFGESD